MVTVLPLQKLKDKIPSKYTISKIKRNVNLPIYNDTIVHRPIKRLKSWHPVWEKAIIDVDVHSKLR